MGDDINVTPGVGKTVAADEISGKLHQRVKLSVGADGEASDLDFGQQTMDNSLPVALASDQDSLMELGQQTSASSLSFVQASDSVFSVGGITTIVRGTLTRASGTAPYSASDVISDSTSSPTAFYIDNCGRINGGGGIVSDISLIDNSNHTTYADLTLWVFDSAYTPINDSGSCLISDTDMTTKYITHIELGGVPKVSNSGADATGNCVYRMGADTSKIPFGFKCVTGSKKLYFMLSVNNVGGWTPISSETFTLVLTIIQD